MVLELLQLDLDFVVDSKVYQKQEEKQEFIM